MGETLSYTGDTTHDFWAGILSSFIKELNDPIRRQLRREEGRSAHYEGVELYMNFPEEAATSEQLRQGFRVEFLKRDLNDKHRLIMKLVTVPGGRVVFVDDKAWVWYHNKTVKRLGQGFFIAAKTKV